MQGTKSGRPFDVSRRRTGARQPEKGSLTLSELILIGIGGIIGAGFFLGCGLPIRIAGPAVLVSFVIGGLLTAQVTGALTSIASYHPVEGSFKVFADMYIGPFAGYMQGWIYYITSVLTIASEAVAMGVFTKMWWPGIPLWISSLTFSAVILLINALGVQNFGRVESFMSVVKIAALAGFIVYIALLLLPNIHGTAAGRASGAGIPLVQSSAFFPHGISGILQSMLIVVFAYAGIGVFATAAPKVRDPRVIDRGALWTIALLGALYIAAIGLLLLIEPWQTVNTRTSPFVLTLERAGAPLWAGVFNAVILVASFSVMAGAVFSANQILHSMGMEREAPRFVTRVSRGGVPSGALACTAGGILLSIGAAYLLPSNIYNFLISASSFMTFFYWFLMLWTFLSWRRTPEGRQSRKSILAFGQPYSTALSMLLIVILTGYALLQRDQRLAFYAFLVLSALVAVSYLAAGRQRRKSLAQPSRDMG